METDRIRHQQTRAARTAEETEAVRESDRISHQHARVRRTTEEEEADRERARERRRCARRGIALCNHADFDASMVSGPDIVSGRHRLPSTTVCEHCNAWKWPGETKKCCCLEGAVKLPPLRPAPSRLLQLYKDPDFRRQIRAYNQAFAFTSIGASCSDRSTFADVNQDESVAGQRGVYTYRIQGAMGHYLGSLLPYTDRRTNTQVAPKFAQIYIVDPYMQQRAERRRGIFSGLDPVVLCDIEALMEEFNPFSQVFLRCGARLRELRASGQDIVYVRFRLNAPRTRSGTHNHLPYPKLVRP